MIIAHVLKIPLKQPERRACPVPPTPSHRCRSASPSSSCLPSASLQWGEESVRSLSSNCISTQDSNLLCLAQPKTILSAWAQLLLGGVLNPVEIWTEMFSKSFGKTSCDYFLGPLCHGPYFRSKKYRSKANRIVFTLVLIEDLLVQTINPNPFVPSLMH